MNADIQPIMMGRIAACSGGRVLNIHRDIAMKGMTLSAPVISQIQLTARVRERAQRRDLIEPTPRTMKSTAIAR